MRWLCLKNVSENNGSNSSYEETQITEEFKQKELKARDKVPFLKDIAEVADPNQKVLERREEIKRIVRSLSAKENGNVFLTGLAGCGKTAIALQIQRDLIEKNFRKELEIVPGQPVRVMYMDMNSLVGDTQENMAKKLGLLTDYLKEFPNTIVVVDEAHQLAIRNPIDPTCGFETIKTFLNTQYSNFIFMCTEEEYQKYVMKVPAMHGQRWRKIVLAEMSEASTKTLLLEKLRQYYESAEYQKARIKVPLKILDMILRTSSKFAPGFANPRKSLTFLEQVINVKKCENSFRFADLEYITDDLEIKLPSFGRSIEDKDMANERKLKEEISSLVKTYIHQYKELSKDISSVVTEEDVLIALKDQTNVDLLKENLLSKKDKMAYLKKELQTKLFGNEKAVEEISSKMEIHEYGMGDPNKPIGVFFLDGKTGTGKTYTAELVADLYCQGNIIKVPCGDYKEAHTVSAITGASASYVGYGDTNALDAVKDHPFSVILLDEIEKAHPDFYKVFMNAFDKAEIDKLDGTKLDFRNCLFLLTSNLSADIVDESEEGVLIRNEKEGKQKLLVELKNNREKFIHNIDNWLTQIAEPERITLQEQDKVAESIKLSAICKEIGELSLLLQSEKDREKIGDIIEKLKKLAKDSERRDLEKTINEYEQKQEELANKLNTNQFGVLKEIEQKALAAREDYLAFIDQQIKALEDPERYSVFDDETPEDNTQRALLQKYLNAHQENIKKGRIAEAIPQELGEEFHTRFEELLKENDKLKEEYAAAKAQIMAEEKNELEQKVKERYYKKYKPEFVNRADGIIVYEKLTEKDLLRIVSVEINKLKRNAERENNNTLHLDTEIIAKFLVPKCDLNEGGRGLKRQFESDVKNQIIHYIQSSLDDLEDNHIYVTVEENQIKISHVKKTREEIKSMYGITTENGDLMKHIHDEIEKLVEIYGDIRINRQEVQDLLFGKTVCDRGVAPENTDPSSWESFSINSPLPIKQNLRQPINILKQELERRSINNAEEIKQAAIDFIHEAQVDFTNSLLKEEGLTWDKLNTMLSSNKEQEKQKAEELQNKLNRTALENPLKITWSFGKEDQFLMEIDYPGKTKKINTEKIKFFHKVKKQPVNPQDLSRYLEEWRGRGVDLQGNMITSLYKYSKLLDLDFNYYLSKGKVTYWLSAPLKIKSEATAGLAESGEDRNRTTGRRKTVTLSGEKIIDFFNNANNRNATSGSEKNNKAVVNMFDAPSISTTTESKVNLQKLEEFIDLLNKNIKNQADYEAFEKLCELEKSVLQGINTFQYQLKTSKASDEMIQKLFERAPLTHASKAVIEILFKKQAVAQELKEIQSRKEQAADWAEQIRERVSQLNVGVAADDSWDKNMLSEKNNHLLDELDKEYDIAAVVRSHRFQDMAAAAAELNAELKLDLKNGELLAGIIDLNTRYEAAHVFQLQKKENQEYQQSAKIEIMFNELKPLLNGDRREYTQADVDQLLAVFGPFYIEFFKLNKEDRQTWSNKWLKHKPKNAEDLSEYLNYSVYGVLEPLIFDNISNDLSEEAVSVKTLLSPKKIIDSKLEVNSTESLFGSINTIIGKIRAASGVPLDALPYSIEEIEADLNLIRENVESKKAPEIIYLLSKPIQYMFDKNPCHLFEEIRNNLDLSSLINDYTLDAENYVRLLRMVEKFLPEALTPDSELYQVIVLDMLKVQEIEPRIKKEMLSKFPKERKNDVGSLFWERAWEIILDDYLKRTTLKEFKPHIIELIGYYDLIKNHSDDHIKLQTELFLEEYLSKNCIRAVEGENVELFADVLREYGGTELFSDYPEIFMSMMATSIEVQQKKYEKLLENTKNLKSTINLNPRYDYFKNAQYDRGFKVQGIVFDENLVSRIRNDKSVLNKIIDMLNSEVEGAKVFSPTSNSRSKKSLGSVIVEDTNAMEENGGGILVVKEGSNNKIVVEISTRHERPIWQYTAELK